VVKFMEKRCRYARKIGRWWDDPDGDDASSWRPSLADE